MHYEDVYSEQELNQKVADYVALGYEVKNRTSSYAKLVKNDFSWGIFIILFLLLLIGALIYLIYYLAFKKSDKDEIIIRVKNNTTNNTNSNVAKHCAKCGSINNEGSNFCENCGDSLNQENKTNNSQKQIDTDIGCPFCDYGIIRIETRKCDYCGKGLDEADLVDCPFCGQKIAIGNEECYHCGELFSGEW